MSKTKKKRDVFIVADDGWKLKTEDELLRFLDSAETYLNDAYPDIALPGWRLPILMSNGHERERLAILLLDRMHELREGLAAPDTPAWMLVALAIRYQDAAMVYRQEITASARGRVHRRGQPGRKPKPNDLAMSVLSHLKHGSSFSWKESLQVMEQRNIINGIKLRRDGPASKPRWIFEKIGRDGKVVSSEDFAESTLEKSFFPKA